MSVLAIITLQSNYIIYIKVTYKVQINKEVAKDAHGCIRKYNIKQTIKCTVSMSHEFTLLIIIYKNP